MLWRQRLAGLVNFLRPFLKLPLEAVGAILDRDVDACAAVLPFIGADVEWSFDDMCRWNDVHDAHCFVDATPDQVGIVCPGREPVSSPFLRAPPPSNSAPGHRSVKRKKRVRKFVHKHYETI